jgi:subtilisin family serine protease/subtilisin-like proprotein convertase family protein
MLNLRRLLASKSPSRLAAFEALEQRLAMSGMVQPWASLTAADLAGPAEPVEVLNWGGFDYRVAKGSWIISFNEQTGGSDAAELAARQVATTLGVNVTDVRAVGRYWAAFETNAALTSAQILRAMPNLPGVKRIEPNRMVETTRVPNDPRYSEQYHHDNTGTFLGFLGKLDADMDSTEAWDVTIGTRQQVVAVIDTGVQITHPDLAANIYVNPGEIPGNGIDDDGNGFVDDVNGWDFASNDNNPNDIEGHGTHVAGIIGAVGNNGIGIAGVNWNVSILPVRVLAPSGGTIEAIVGGIDYVTMLRENGVPIAAANASYGGPGSRFYEDVENGFDAERDAIVRFIQEGGTFVAAAGNDSADNDDDITSFPASYKIPGLISVASTDWDDRMSGFSNYGAETVDLGAPGDEILSTVPTDSYAYMGGTSMASPQVAGAVALLRAVKPTASAVEIRQTLLDSVDPIADLQGKTVSGGRLNIARALEIIGLTGPVVRTVLPGPVTGQVDPATNTALRTLTIKFNRAIDPTKISTSVVEVRRDGNDNTFGTGDDALITVTNVAISQSDPREMTISLNVNILPGQRLAIDRYRLTLRADAGAGEGIFDTDGNFLNGNSVAGTNEEFFFNVVPVSGTYEINDTMALATPVDFAASGQARFTGVTMGDGIYAGLDVDIFKLNLARGGQITAEITAKRRATGSNLDSYLRLFDANGNQIAANDQFFGQDSFIDYYVSTGGTYYVAVSGYGNSTYNPGAAASGNAQSTGLYDLTVTATLNSDDTVSGQTEFTEPMRIPANGTQGVIESTINITDARQIIDANVQVRLRHSFVSDLRVSLISPSGTVVTLSNRRGGSGQDMTPTLFDDEAPQTIASASAPFAGTFSPDTPLGAIDGQAATGTWRLRIEDLSAGGSGFLDGWRLDLRVENDIFGDFEPNDTIPNARDLAQISNNGYGATTINAFMGDGGFGLLDRDIFKFKANAGSSLTTQAIGGSATAIRLFNAQGQQLILAVDSNTSLSRIENFVFNDAGYYYIAVSSADNVAYNPFDVSSGVPSTDTGNYSLSVSVVDGVSDGAILLSGNSLQIGSNGLGFMAVSGDTPTGLRYNNIEFLGGFSSSKTFFGASADGSVFKNSLTNAMNDVSSQISFSMTDESDTYNRRTVAQALFNGNLKIERSFSFGISDNFVAIDVQLTNVGSTAIGSLSWMEGFNPEMGMNLDPSTPNTENDLDASGRMATASFFNNTFLQGLTIGLAAPSDDTRASARILSNGVAESLRDSDGLLGLTQVDPDGTSSDSYMTLAYNLGTVAAGGSVQMRYFIFLGDTQASVDSLYSAVNNGTGTGHLTASADSPATELLEDGSNVPQLPYRYYFPEGFATPNTNTFIPILNLSDQNARVVVVARYESGVRDQLLADFNGAGKIAANSRSGITITNPQLFAAGEQLVRPYEGYAVEIRSDRPIAPTFSHYDTNLTTTAASIGESFTTRISTTWTFSEVVRGGSNLDFLLFQNTSSETTKIESTFYPLDGGEPIVFTQTVEGHRRLGLNLAAAVEIPEGTYGVKVTSQQPIVAVMSHYDTAARTAEGVNGLPTLGSMIGATSEGDLGQDAIAERFSILNASAQNAQVSLVFLFSSGSSYRAVVTVPAESQRSVNVGDLVGFPVGEDYSMQYTSTAPVSMALIASAYGDQLISSVTDRAYRYWGFGEGFKPRDGNPLVTEALSLYNPNATDTIAEIVLRYDANLGTESLRVVVPARTAFSLNVHDLVTGSRRLTEVWYGISVKSAAPIVASFTHADAFFPGAFSTLGTPIGQGFQIS